MDTLIQIRDLSFQRGERLIFDRVSLNIPRGKITAVMGPSGSGKTTLLKLISAQLEPRLGNVLVDNQNMHSLSRQEMLIARRKMGMLFQSGALFTHLSVFENVAFPLREHSNLPEDLLRTVVLMKLQAVGLRGAAHLMPAELSGGMARRVALARAIALDPALMMYDEPFAGQDPITMGVLMRLIKKLNELLGITSIVVSHDVDETLSIADYVYIIAGGKIIGQGTSDTIRHCDEPMVRQFIFGEADGQVPFHFPAGDYQEALLHA